MKPTWSTTPPVRPIDLGAPRRVHLLGIGGAGMSAIATVLAGHGHRVTGTDQRDSAAVDRLRAIGIEVHIGHAAGNLADAEIVARSTAVRDDNVEVAAAFERGLGVYRRDELLAAITGLHDAVAIAGTHGKTTTSSMLTVALRHVGLDPSFIIGGRVDSLGTGAALGGDLLVVEADESDGTFLRLQSHAAVVTSVEPDHLDYYETVEAFEQAFIDFVDGIATHRLVCVDDDAAARVAGVSGAPTYGTSAAADWRIVDHRPVGTGGTFTLNGPDGSRDLEVALPGIHNARNAAAAFVMGCMLGVAPDDMAAGIAGFSGVGRRYEHRGAQDGITFIDDYAHLPGEVELTLDAAADGPHERVVCAFQPHRYTRTRDQAPHFARAFTRADVLFVTELYTAGEPPIDGVSGRLVLDAVRDANPDADVRWASDLHELTMKLAAELRPGDLCLTLGAGDLTTVPDLVMDARTP